MLVADIDTDVLNKFIITPAKDKGESTDSARQRHLQTKGNEYLEDQNLSQRLSK